MGGLFGAVIACVAAARPAGLNASSWLAAINQTQQKQYKRRVEKKKKKQCSGPWVHGITYCVVLFGSRC
jgi:hypothetical protein